MHISLFLLSSIMAIFFITLSEKLSRKWMKNSFLIYGIMFSITTIIVSAIYINEIKSPIRTTFAKNSQLNYEHLIKPKFRLHSHHNLKETVQLNAPLISQLPELPRGCEVTALAMLLQYNQVEAKKNELAKEVKKNPAQYSVTDEGIHFGNPHRGFVGDMYSFDTPGLGVYHEPIAELAAEYVDKNRVYDFTGESFTQILDQLNEGRPVWVIINATYKELSNDHFVTWLTDDGPIEITMRQHSVLVTGYDHEYIYFNDPLQRDSKAKINDFNAAWAQMGKQAITIY